MQSDGIIDGALKTLTWEGRLSRRGFWTWFPLVAAFPVALYWYMPQPLTQLGLLGILLSNLPLMALGGRRLQDTGEPGHSIMLPYAPILYFFVFLWFLDHGFDTILGGVPWLIAILLVPLLWLIFVACCFASIVWIGPLIGQLLLPSQPGPNQFGPNPHEVVT